MMNRYFLVLTAILSGVLIPLQLHAEDAVEAVGIDEHLGEKVPLDKLKFYDESGAEVAFKELFDMPIVLTLVYYRCPGICTPVLQEVASAMGKTDLIPGVDYRAITVSFEPKETFEMAAMKKENMIAEVKNHDVPDQAWRFFTGTQENISALSNAVGFLYKRDTNEVDYIHSGTVMFISEKGKIVRYLNGLSINPVNFKMAVLDAEVGFPRSFIQSVQKYCYAFDPKGQEYKVKVNRIIGAVTIAFVVIFGGFLLLTGRKGGGGLPPAGGKGIDTAQPMGGMS
jgi:protein SCO1/2